MWTVRLCLPPFVYSLNDAAEEIGRDIPQAAIDAIAKRLEEEGVELKTDIMEYGGLGFNRWPERPCCWLDLDTGLCRYYEFRPHICAEYDCTLEEEDCLISQREAETTQQACGSEQLACWRRAGPETSAVRADASVESAASLAEAEAELKRREERRRDIEIVRMAEDHADSLVEEFSLLENTRDVVQRILDLLNDPSRGTRYATMDAVAKLPAQFVVEAVTQLVSNDTVDAATELDDDDVAVRLFLSQVKEEHPSEEARCAAATALKVLEQEEE